MRRAAWILVAQSLLSGPAAAQESTITSVAGGGYWSQPLDGVPATSTYMEPVAVAVDSAGNLFVTDIYNQRVRKATALQGSAGTEGRRPARA